jgi:hypothetical protein
VPGARAAGPSSGRAMRSARSGVFGSSRSAPRRGGRPRSRASGDARVRSLARSPSPAPLVSSSLIEHRERERRRPRRHRQFDALRAGEFDLPADRNPPRAAVVGRATGGRGVARPHHQPLGAATANRGTCSAGSVPSCHRHDRCRRTAPPDGHHQTRDPGYPETGIRAGFDDIPRRNCEPAYMPDRDAKSRTGIWLAPAGVVAVQNRHRPS